MAVWAVHLRYKVHVINVFPFHLDYTEDSSADADSNFILTDNGGIVEIQATAEKSAFNEAQFNELLVLARQGTGSLFALQRQALGG